MEIDGLWVGLMLGVIAYSLAQQCYVLFYVDWRHEVKVCLARLAHTSSASVYNDCPPPPYDESHHDGSARQSCYGSFD
ncbi:hypothetical protein EV175_007500 [Coemansia sp. RSA 1933]|nr:hypothetical protein EV175_007500 [Coemansia sp. RSA 1933]